MHSNISQNELRGGFSKFHGFISMDARFINIVLHNTYTLTVKIKRYVLYTPGWLKGELLHEVSVVFTSTNTAKVSMEQGVLSVFIHCPLFNSYATHLPYYL